MLNGDIVNIVCKDKLTKLIKFSATILYYCINLLKTNEDHWTRFICSVDHSSV